MARRAPSRLAAVLLLLLIVVLLPSSAVPSADDLSREHPDLEGRFPPPPPSAALPPTNATKNATADATTTTNNNQNHGGGGGGGGGLSFAAKVGLICLGGLTLFGITVSVTIICNCGRRDDAAAAAAGQVALSVAPTIGYSSAVELQPYV